MKFIITLFFAVAFWPTAVLAQCALNPNDVPVWTPIIYTASHLARGEAVRDTITGWSDGKVYVAGAGMSNAGQLFSGWRLAREADPEFNVDTFTFLGGQKSGMTTEYWGVIPLAPEMPGYPMDVYADWERQIRYPERVEVVIVHHKNRWGTEGWLDRSRSGDMPSSVNADNFYTYAVRHVQEMEARLPNLKMVYFTTITSGSYGGFFNRGRYIPSRTMREPHNFDQGRIAIQRLIDTYPGNAWIGAIDTWGGNGHEPTPDGFLATAEQSESDCTHLSPLGQMGYGELMHAKMKQDPTTLGWYHGGDVVPPPPPPPPATYDLLIDGVVGCSSCEWGDVLSGLAPGADVQTITKQ